MGWNTKTVVLSTAQTAQGAVISTEIIPEHGKYFVDPWLETFVLLKNVRFQRNWHLKVMSRCAKENACLLLKHRRGFDPSVSEGGD